MAEVSNVRTWDVPTRLTRQHGPTAAGSSVAATKTPTGYSAHKLSNGVPSGAMPNEGEGPSSVIRDLFGSVIPRASGNTDEPALGRFVDVTA